MTTGKHLSLVYTFPRASGFLFNGVDKWLTSSSHAFINYFIQKIKALLAFVQFLWVYFVLYNHLLRGAT